MLAAIAEADASAAPAAREAVRDRRVHRRLLPPRPGADEGDHRRGDARGQHVRAAPTWRRSATPTRGSPRSSSAPRRTARSATEITPEFAALAFYGCGRAGADRLDLRHRAGRRGRARARQDADRRDDLPRARALSHAYRTGDRASLIESRPMTESPLVKRLMWSGLLAGIGALASLATTRVAADDLDARVRRRTARVSDQPQSETPEPADAGRLPPRRPAAPSPRHRLTAHRVATASAEPAPIAAASPPPVPPRRPPLAAPADPPRRPARRRRPSARSSPSAPRSPAASSSP